MLNRIFRFVSLIGCVASFSLYDLIINKVTCECGRPDDLDVSEVKAYYYNFKTNSNATYLLKYAAENITARSDFDEEQCIHVFVPGFTDTIDTPSSFEASCTFSKIECNGMKIIGIIIDHSEYTNGNFLQKVDYVNLYQEAVIYTKSIAIAIGNFLAKILAKVAKEYVVASGHSLGAQMIGFAAGVAKAQNYPLGLVTAIDPASPCFHDCVEEHVNKTQADTVVAIHCNAGELGSYLNMTNYDAYSGNGVIQEGCMFGNAVDLLLKAEASSCSHSKCVPISFQTVLRSNIWKAQKCDSFEDYGDEACAYNEATLIGYGIKPTGSEGVYFFDPDTSNMECTES